jgi:hypothetical protein
MAFLVGVDAIYEELDVVAMRDAGLLLAHF